MVADTLVYHPSVAQYLRYVATTVGRDKLLRAIQYFARFYAWYLLRTNGTPAQMAPWNVLKRQLGLTRKILRVGKPVEHLKAAAVAADAKSTPALLRYASVGRQLGYAGYLTFDALALPDAMGVRKWHRAADAQRHAYRFWAVGIIFSVAAQLYTLRQLKRREAAIDRKDGEGVVESKRIKMERSVSRLQLLCDLCDLAVPTSALGWAGFDDGFVGLAGTLSSVIGMYTQWKKSA
ncbi:peroxisomal biogenesis factor 11 (PEX11) domain-containing protein [Hirsutella rhossiliensis]|uniref:Peroxisomal biogenesis factor 11 (PEX11) domain-containing protein n=1 Tax=Hirsutella rhossiliensis TaxID=111463 RepID=A0A9P8MLW6_9HYPO|nr:peroxisomal biogenesis factor 11 (PEX11) domain-containing protein [Hirsutella rhossiliensis]KAH0958633.1 peroxisomal biogenesis factor 11 (PEX11) domain-containing protein [Hirsutella rhossiliensis]